MPRLALASVCFGLAAILVTVLIVLGDATLPGRVPPLMVAGLAGLGGLLLVLGLWRLDPGAGRRQTFSG
jgi:hypothetical protein